MEKENIPSPDQIDGTWQEIRDKIETQTEQLKQKQKEQKSEDPQPASPNAKQIHPKEPTPGQVDESGAQKRKEGSKFPMPSKRPEPPSKVKEEGNVIVAKALAEQLGTSPELKANMMIDERKMAVLNPGTLSALSHFSFRHVYDGIRYWGHITEWELIGSQGIGGLARRHILQALANTSGVQSVEKAKAPNAVARNLWDRDWKQKAEQEGKVVDE